MKFIIIKSVDKPYSDDPDSFISWFCKSFGLESEIENSDSIEKDLLKQFINAALAGKGISSSDLTENFKIARTTIIYHLNRLIEAGWIVKRGRMYYLRGKELSDVIEEIEYDINREMMKMLDIAKQFDRLSKSRSENKKFKKVKIE
ncbi:ArsR family transcriptional regulator [Candidatus Mancarchaeum acidiphilum]|uniref:ArsR family transcriptional regulator n=1 Tax=Candidatus Mancarchaeum acidiphilum TaxID=1920749 RepID=A0A218NM23_9ARCH|nr:winged helix-turn-helix domain-containing protein [Candidatus Mancarchaeum acidiphilum]ASI13515.1 ArsR family transcriptional regulator [Candidatus Mancarchaeum acidiphilum]